jgi:serine phosphatase RsbU (regulator of sigma subunit)
MTTGPAPRQPGPAQAPEAPGGVAELLRVLLVEDDEADAFLVGELLDEVGAAVEVTVATTLREAQAKIANVDCVLLDLGLPDAQGLDGLRRLLAGAGTAAICVLTGLGDDHIGAAAVGEGAQDYLIKGQVDGNVLARSLRYAVERKRADENARRLHQVVLLQQESTRLERGLLPQPLIRTADVQVEPFYQPGRRAELQPGMRAELGGDFYDVVQVRPDRLAMMVGDVCGHGVDEAALGVELRVAWRALTLAEVDDDAVLPAIEQVLISERNRVEVFATLAMITLDLGTGRGAVRLAGHPPPLLLSRGDATAVPAVFGPVLGVLDRAERPATEFQLDGDDWTLLMYTDGLIEGRTSDRDRRLGVTGLRALITEAAERGVARRDLAAWLAAKAEEANGGPLADDIAILLLSPSGSAR